MGAKVVRIADCWGIRTLKSALSFEDLGDGVAKCVAV